MRNNARVNLPTTRSLPARPDEAFDRFTRLVRAQFGVPAAMVSLVSVSGQVLPGASGLPEPWQSERFTPLSHSFCQYVVGSSAPLVVTDARQDPLLHENLAISDLGVVAYAGMPLLDAAGEVVGALCALDNRPRQWTPAELDVLADLAATCSANLQLRHAQDAARRAERDTRTLLALSEALSDVMTVQDVAGTVTRVAREALDARYSGVSLLDAAGRSLRYIRSDTLPGAGDNLWQQMDLGAELPSATAARTGTALFYRDNQAMLADFPGLVDDPNLPLAQGRALLPLMVDGRSVGAIMLSWEDEHEVDRAEHALLAALARYTAQAIRRAQLVRERREVAETLQRAMLTELPEVPGLELAAVYVPASAAERVGGDWYDAVPLPDGTTALAIGDVTGHDMTAAAAMGQLHTLLRAFVYDRHGAPSRIVARLDRTIRGLRIDAVATALLARLEPPDEPGGLWRMCWSSAGHLPPVVLLPDGGTRVLEPKPDLLLGIDADTVRHDHECDVPAGSILVLYTDGLIERAGASLAEGVERLRAALSEERAVPTLDGLLDALIGRLVLRRTRDDCAVLAVRLLPDVAA